MYQASTPSGAEMVVLTREEYDCLTAVYEDIADGAMSDAARAENGNAPTMPSELLRASLDGTIHPLTAWRSAVGLTMAALSDRAGVRAATISDIENGKLDPRYSTLRAIADALQLDIDDIMPD